MQVQMKSLCYNSSNSETCEVRKQVTFSSPPNIQWQDRIVIIAIGKPSFKKGMGYEAEESTKAFTGSQKLWNPTEQLILVPPVPEAGNFVSFQKKYGLRLRRHFIWKNSCKGAKGTITILEKSYYYESTEYLNNEAEKRFFYRER